MRALLILLALLLASITVHSQSLPGPNSRVRVYAPSVGDARVIGRLGPAMGDSVRFRPEGGDEWQSLRISEIGELELSRGRASQAALGVFVGGLAGAAYGASEGGSGDCAYVCGAARFVGGVVGALGGALVGGIVGSQLKSGEERWRRVFP